MADEHTIKQNVENIRRQCEAHSRAAKPALVLIAVTKTFPPEAVRAAYAAGVCHIGENYLQEASAKITACADLPLTWHFIGSIQKNKTAAIARLFDWAHGVDSLIIAERLSAARQGAAPLNIFMQVNISEQASKSGAPPAQAAALAQAIAALPGVRLRGVMILPEIAADSARQYAVFCRAVRLQNEIIEKTGVALDCLSMGMSGDYQQAVRAGATHIRLGTAIFGARTKKKG